MAVVNETKRRDFVRHFAMYGNATAAARAVGIPESSAHSVGYKWLRNEKVTATKLSRNPKWLRDF